LEPVHLEGGSRVDRRIEALARNLLDYSLALQAGDNLLVEGESGSEELIRALIEQAFLRGAHPFFDVADTALRRVQLLHGTREQMDMEVGWRLARAKQIDAFLFIAAGRNQFEFSDVPPETMRQFELARKPIREEILPKRWVELRFPTPSGAQAARMSTEAFADFCFRVSTLDYTRMDRAMDPLVELMERTDRVEIRGPGTDLSFSIKGLPAVKCAGKLNVPDGEVFTAPVRESVTGTITYNTPSFFFGVTCESVSLRFEEGRIIKATGTPQETIDSVFATDEGARYVGEFALGVNPYVEAPMKDTLFDEKIRGSLHFTPGAAYEEVCDNGNRSAIHWDLVLIQTPEWGGGEIWFDGVLVRQDGRFVLPELQGLNPENLV
jgi:aminopeptidase